MKMQSSETQKNIQCRNNVQTGQAATNLIKLI